MPYYPPTSTGGAGALDDLSDVTITTPSTNQVLKYNGSQWVNGTDATGVGGGMVWTTTTIDFSIGGTHLTKAITDASVVTGQKILVTLLSVATATNTVDDHTVSDIQVYGGNPVAGVGFTIFAVSTSLAHGEFTVAYTLI